MIVVIVYDAFIAEILDNKPFVIGLEKEIIVELDGDISSIGVLVKDETS